jgi:hypothetical protein
MKNGIVFSITVTICILIFHTQALAEGPSFESGISAYQKQEYDKATEIFGELLKSQGPRPDIVTNWGLAQARLGKVGWAAGAFRHALLLKANHREAKKGLEFLYAEGLIREMPRELESWESFRTQVLNVGSLEVWTLVLVLTLAGSLSSLVGFLGARKRALASESPLPQVPLSGICLGFLSLLALGITLAKVYDSGEHRSTIVVGGTKALTAPHPESPELFQLNEGLEVIVRQSKEGWSQITYPGASTGWVPTENLYPITR